MKNRKNDKKNKSTIIETSLIIAIFIVITLILVVITYRSNNRKTAPASSKQAEVTASQNTGTPDDDNYEILGPKMADGLEYDYDDLTKYIKICDISEIKADYDKQVATEEQVNLTIAELLAQAGTSEAVEDRAAQKGDTVTVSGSGFFPDTEERFSLSEDTSLVIGTENGFPAGFDDNLIGYRTGESATFTFTYPSDYNYSNFAGRTVEYDLTIKDIKLVTPVEFNDEFVASQKVDGVATTDEYRDYVRDKLEKTIAQQNEQNAQSAIFKAVVDSCEVVEYPEKELQYYLDYADKTVRTYANATATSEEDYKINNYGSVEAFEEGKQKSARDSVKEDLVVKYFAKEFDISISNDDYDKALKYGYENTGKKNGVTSLADFEKMNRESLTKGLLTLNVVEALADKIPH